MADNEYQDNNDNSNTPIADALKSKGLSDDDIMNFVKSDSSSQPQSSNNELQLPEQEAAKEPEAEVDYEDPQVKLFNNFFNQAKSDGKTDQEAYDLAHEKLTHKQEYYNDYQAVKNANGMMDDPNGYQTLKDRALDAKDKSDDLQDSLDAAGWKIPEQEGPPTPIGTHEAVQPILDENGNTISIPSPKFHEQGEPAPGFAPTPSGKAYFTGNGNQVSPTGEIPTSSKQNLPPPQIMTNESEQNNEENQPSAQTPGIEAKNPQVDTAQALINAQGQQSINTRDALQAAQNRYDQQALLYQLGAAAQKIGAGIGAIGGKGWVKPTEPNTEWATEGQKIAAQQLKNYQDLQAKEMDDSNSQVSQSYRNVLRQMNPNINIPENLSASDVEKVQKQLVSLQESQQKAEANQIQRQYLMQYKEQQNMDKSANQFNQQLEFNKGRMGNGAKVEGMILGSDRIDQIVNSLPKDKNGNPDLNQVSPYQKAEFLKAYDAMISGQSSIHGQQSLDSATRTGYDSLAKIQQWFSGAPAPTNTGPLVQNMLDSVHRERNLAQEQLKDMGYGAVGSVKQDYFENDPRYKNLLGTKFGMDQDDIDLRHKGLRANDIAQLKNAGYQPVQLNQLINNKQDVQKLLQQTHIPNTNQFKPGPPMNGHQNTILVPQKDGRTGVFDADTKQPLGFL